MEKTQVQLVRPWHKNDPVEKQRYPAHQSLADSYAHQWYRLNLHGVEYEVRPSDAATADHLPVEPCFIISAWNPAGAPKTFDDNQDLHAALGRRLLEAGFVSDEAVTFAGDGSWFESSWVVRGASETATLALAAQFEQIAVVRWDMQGLHVISRDSDAVPNSTQPWTITRLNSKPCPMKLLERSSECTPAGGPWVSRSMAVGAAWQEHRRLALKLVGCGVCDDGKKVLRAANGQAHLLNELLLSSRFGGPDWSDRRTAASSQD